MSWGVNMMPLDVKHTLAFQDVLHDAILPYAFSASCYPLVLSIENHCNKEQQDRMAEHFKAILGQLLYTAPVDTSRWMGGSFSIDLGTKGACLTLQSRGR